MPESRTSSSLNSATPDYAGLVRFLVQPFLEVPTALRVDCEVFPSRSKVLVRVAFEGSDKGRVFGRGGRNIQAIRTVLAAAAQMTGYSAHLDVFGASGSEGEGHYESSTPRGDRPRRSAGPVSDRRQEPRPEEGSSKPRPRPVPKVAPPSSSAPGPSNLSPSDFSPSDFKSTDPDSAESSSV